MDKFFDKLFNENVARAQSIAAYRKLIPTLVNGAANKASFVYDCN